MYTATSKQIMAPVAEAISHLMILNLEAEAKNTVLPDLTELATVVDQQAKNLISVGQSMVESGDEQLKVDMPAACEMIAQASLTLLESTFDLQLTPSSKEGRQKLLQGCSGLLEGTVKLLDVYDECEIRRIVHNCQICISNLETLKTIYDVQSLVQHVKPTCQQLVDVTHVARLRVDELIYPALQDRLREAIDGITKTSALLVSTSKAVAQNPKNDAASNARIICCDNISDNLKEIQTVVQIREYQEAQYNMAEQGGNIQDARRDVYKHLSNIMKSVQDNDHSGLLNAKEMLGFDSNTVLGNAELIAKRVGNAQIVEARVFEIRKALNEIEKASTDAILPGHENDQVQLHEKLMSAQTLYHRLESETDQVLANTIRNYLVNNKNHNDKESSLNDFYLSAKTGDSANFKSKTAQMVAQRQEFHEALNQLALRSPDSETFKVIKQYEQALQRSAKLLDASALSVNASPNDKSALETFDGVVSAWEAQIEKMDDLLKKNGLLKLTDAVGSDVSFLKQNLNNFDLAKPREGNDGLKYAANAVNAGKRLLSTAKAEAEKTEDSKLKLEYSTFANHIEKELKIMSQTYPNLKDAQIQHAFIASGKSLLENAEKMANFIQGMDVRDVNFVNIPAPITKKEPLPLPTLNTNEPYFATVDGEEVQVVDSAPPEALPDEEVKSNPIKAAAHDLNLVTSAFSKKDNAMIDKSSTLAEKMAALASHYKTDTPTSKKMMITLAKEIFDECAKFIAEGKRIHDACTDKSLKNQLKVAMDSIQSLSVQLKIVTAVKVAEPKDLDSEKSLILCCQNLMNAVKVTIKASEIASLRAFKVAGKAALGMIKFRKILYKKKGGK